MLHGAGVSSEAARKREKNPKFQLRSAAARAAHAGWEDNICHKTWLTSIRRIGPVGTGCVCVLVHVCTEHGRYVSGFPKASFCILLNGLTFQL